MDTTVDALKALYTALGGTASTVTNITLIPDMINAIATLISGGGGARLPEVSASNNGQILTVSSGEWTVAAPASQLPAVTASDNGDVLTVVEGAWTNAALPD